jgi:hypothetical protein
MTIAEVIKNTSNTVGDYNILFNDFLDEFYRSGRDTKAALVKDEPEVFGNIPIQKYAFIAGSVEKLCNDSGLEPPEWVFKENYFLKDPMFALNAKGNLRVVLLVESPNEFVVRNIFVSENCLQRA